MATDDDLGSSAVPAEQVEVEPWFAVWADDPDWPGQAERHADVVARCGARLGERVYLAQGASIACASLRVGDRSFVATGCVLRDDVELGDDVSLNPYVTVAGTVRIGDGVRVASYAALYGFNHRFDDLGTPIWLQGLDTQGIVVEDDVWIGTHAVVCDGVTVGTHSVVAAGAVVTTDVPPWSVVAGVPARVVRDRRDGTGAARDGTAPTASSRATATDDATSGGRTPRDPLDRFAERVADQWRDVLDRCRVEPGPHGDGFVDRPGTAPSLRPTCDAVELAAAFGDVDGAGPRQDLAARLQARQDPVTGLFPDPSEPALEPGGDPLALDLDAEFRHYGVLSVGYALELLGAAPRHPVACVADCDGDELVRRLDALPWRTLAWPAGSWVDAFATAVHLDRRHHGAARGLEPMFGWLQTRQDPRSGMWGAPDPTWGWLMPVNGWYRLVRGTYAQFDLPVPHAEACIDTVAAHARDNGWFTARSRDACNVLDVVHPLWWCARWTDHRRTELRDRLAGVLVDTVDRWHDGAGFSFAEGGEPGLQGTEMWLSIVWLAADSLGCSDGLPWRPRGVHRPEPVDRARVAP